MAGKSETLFWVTSNVLYLDLYIGYRGVQICKKNYQSIHLRAVQFTVCVFYFNKKIKKHKLVAHMTWKKQAIIITIILILEL